MTTAEMQAEARVSNFDFALQTDRTCAHHPCNEFGTHRVTTVVDGEAEDIQEWMCDDHSLGYIMVLRLGCSDEAKASRVKVAR